MGNNLLVSLRKYRPRENSDPLENFITEAFAWILNNHPEFGKFFLKRIVERLNNYNIEIQQNPEWETQKNFNRKYPDMFCQVDEAAFIFEHKAWSHLHPNQLKNYRDFAEKNFPKYYLILITGGIHLHEQDPDLRLCWYDIYKWINSWLSEQKNKEDFFILNDFLELLKIEGMGPPATISHEAILSYYSSRYLRNHISDLIHRISKNNWKELVKEDFRLDIPELRHSLFGDIWGRIGINLLDGWDPGIFVGFMLDGEDHNISPLMPNSPDCSVIIDFDFKYHENYADNDLYKTMIEDLRKRVETSDLGWDFHNHLENSDNPNFWHPIHIRIPMVKLFSGTSSSQEQDSRFTKKISEVLSIINECSSFWDLRSSLKKITNDPRTNSAHRKL